MPGYHFGTQNIQISNFNVMPTLLSHSISKFKDHIATLQFSNESNFKQSIQQKMGIQFSKDYSKSASFHIVFPIRLTIEQ